MRILAAVLIVALIAAAYFAISLRTERQENRDLQNTVQTRIADSDREIQNRDENITALKSEIAVLQGDIAAAKIRAAERETELTQLREKSEKAESELALSKRRLEFEYELSRLPHYDHAAQILALPTVTLSEAQNMTCAAGFKDSAGKPVYIGGPGASREVAGFINSLVEGKTYTLPADFAAYLKKNPPEPEQDKPPEAKNRNRKEAEKPEPPKVKDSERF